MATSGADDADEFTDGGSTAEYIRVEGIKGVLTKLRAREHELRETEARVQTARVGIAAEIAVAESELDDAVNAPVRKGQDPTLWLPDELLMAILLVVPMASLWKKQCSLVCRRWAGTVRGVSVQRRLREGRWEAYAAKWIEPRLIGRHADFLILALGVGRDGTVYSGDMVGTIKAWGSSSGVQPLWSIQAHATQVKAITVCMRGNVYSGSNDRTVGVWSGVDGTHLRTLRGHERWVHAVAVGADNKVYSGSHDCTVRVWSGEDGSHLQTLIGHTSSVRALAIGRDGRVYSGSGDCTIRVWAHSDGAHLYTLAGHTDQVRCLACGPDGIIYSGSQDTTIRAWSATDGTHVRTLHGLSEVTALACSPDNRVYSFSGGDRVLRIWSSGHGGNRPLASLYIGQVFDLAIRPDGTVCTAAKGAFAW
jgi:hypothetical protein